VFLLQLLLVLTATCRRGSSKLKAFTPTVFWLLMCFIIHSWIEYNFVFNRANNKSGFQNGMNLYGAADYRYGFGENLELEPGTAAMEAITALITGPLCLLLAWGIVGNKPWRWAVQLITCSCQMYGLAWFMAHPFFSADKISSDDPFLYWVIFVGFNAPSVIWTCVRRESESAEAVANSRVAHNFSSRVNLESAGGVSFRRSCSSRR
jgi:hypothetical protein